MKYLLNGFRGFCMALADSVPGVSGGTIAFVLGFYDKFINSLNDIAFGDKDKKKEALKFLIKLFIGWGIGMVLAALVLSSLFESHIYEISSLFIGFIMFSIPSIIKEEKAVLKNKYINLIYLLLGIILVFIITYFNPVGTNDSIVNLSNLNLGLGIYLFIVAMVAISAMVLPGISGSTILLIFGLYIPVMNAIKEFLHFNFSYFLPLFIFGLGIITGVIVVIKLIRKALVSYRSQMIYFIIGLMIGSFYAIIMGPTTLEVPMAPMSLDSFNIIYFIIGGLIILALEKLKTITNKDNYEA